jgi:hypothetical protein
MSNIKFEKAKIEDLEINISRHSPYREYPLSGRPNDPAIAVEQITLEFDSEENPSFTKRVRNDFNAPLSLISVNSGELNVTIQRANMIGNPVRITVQPNHRLGRQ